MKPEFWTDETLAECSTSARLLFIATWNFADDHGNLERSARQLKAQAFPYDSIDCEPLVVELLKVGVLVEYDVDGKKYLHIKGFSRHQKVEKPAKPRYPFPDSSPSPRVEIGEDLPTSNGSSLGREGKGREASQEASPPSPPARKTNGKKPQTVMPDGFAMTGELRSYAEQQLPDADVDGLFQQFRDQATAKSWTYADWPKAWQVYVRNARKDSGHWASGQYPKRGANGVRWQ